MEYGSPRRIVLGLLLVVILWGSSLGLVGFASAGKSTEELPASYDWPAHRVGDRGSYSLTYVHDDGGEPTVLADPRPYLDFEWLQSGLRQGFDGEMHHVFRLRHTWHDVQDGEVVTGTLVQELDSTTHEVIAYGYESTEVQAWGTARAQQVFLVRPDEGFYVPCGLFAKLAGTSFDPRDEHVLYPACGWESYWAQDVGFTSMVQQTVGGKQALYVEQTTPHNDAQDIHLWLGHDHAYPLRMAVEDQGAEDHFLVMRLTRFAAGNEPLVPGPAGSRVPPALDFVAWGDGPAEPRDHPFPLDAALEASVDHPEAEPLREFMARHPDAYLRAADYMVETQDDTTSRSWSMEYGMGADTLSWMMSQRDAPIAQNWMVGPIPTMPRETTLHLDFDRAGAAGGTVPDRELVPDVPTVESLRAVWAFHGGAAGDRYGFRIICADADCTSARAEAWAGTDVATGTSGRGVPPVMLEQGTDVRVAGAFTYIADDLRGPSMQFSTYEFDSAPAPAPAVRPQAAAAVATYSTSVWDMPPSAAVAGAGLLSLVVGIGYFLCPTIKSGAASVLFSRVSGPEVAQHPVRRRILDAVAAEPGIHLRKVQRHASIGRGALDHHVRKLEAEGLLKRVVAPGATCLFLRGSMDHARMEAMPAVRSEGARRVLQYVRESPGASLSEAARRLGLSASNVHHHVKRLEAAGLVEVQRASGRLQWQASAAAARL